MIAVKEEISGNTSIKAKDAITEKLEAKENKATKALLIPKKVRFSIGVSLCLKNFMQDYYTDFWLYCLPMYKNNVSLLF